MILNIIILTLATTYTYNPAILSPIAEKSSLYLQPIITQYFIDNKSEIWLLFLIAHSKR